jgi:hypothetical protein
MTIGETWRLVEGGRRLSIHRHTSSARGEQDTEMVFNRR